MTFTPTDKPSKDEIAEILRRVLSAELDPITGCRLLCAYRRDCPVRDEEIWSTLIWFDSETDEYPVGEVRNRYSAEYLQKIDDEIKPYIQECWPAVKDSCEKLLRALDDG